MSVQPNNAMGVKVEPKILRDPSALESISSALHDISNYVAHNLPSLRKVAGSASGDTSTYQNSATNPHQDHLSSQFLGDIDSQTQASTDFIPETKKDIILYAAFDKIEYTAPSAHNVSAKRSVLLLGYPDGFQMWDVNSIDNIHELVSIRDEEKFGEVTFAKVVSNPNTPKVLHQDLRPLLAIICTPKKSSLQDNDIVQETSPKPKSSLNFFSLRTHEIIKTMDFEGEGTVTSVKCNERAIVVSLSNPPRLHILSTSTLNQCFPSPLTDVATHPITHHPIFSLGPRLLAYATTSRPLEGGGKKEGGYLLGEADESNSGTGTYQEVAKDVVQGVAKEVVNGVKLLGDYGYQTISAYFSNSSNSPGASPKPPTTMPINIKNGTVSPSSFSPQPSPSNGYYYTPSVASSGGDSNGTNNSLGGVTNGVDNEAIGAIIIRDLGLQISPQIKKQPPIIAHFQPHTHPVGYLSFNPSGTLLFSTSTQGHKFHVFEILGKRRKGGSHKGIKHMYRLARGYTNASVGEGAVSWSEDSRWCAVATGRGTTHVFAINPYGGPTHIPSHIKGWVLNAEESFPSSTQSPVVRIKSRTVLPPDPLDPANFPSQPSNHLFSNFLGLNEYYSLPPTDSSPSSAANSPARPLNSLLNQNANPNNLYNSNQQLPHNGVNSTVSVPLLRKQPGICLKFLSTDLPLTNGLGVTNGISKRNAKRRSSPSATMNGGSGNTLSGQPAKVGRRRTKSWTQNSLTGMRNYLDDADENEKEDGVCYQDILSFHPAGLLTLHRIWVEGVLTGGENVDQGKEDGNNLIGNAAAVANMGRVLVDGAAGVVGISRGITGTGRKDAVQSGESLLCLLVNYEDVAEWNLLRGQAWCEVKNVVEAPQNPKDNDPLKKRDSGKRWLANAEIATHTTSRMSLPPPLWLTPQFTFQTYQTGYKDALMKGDLPRAKKIEIRREIVVEEECEGNSFIENGWAKDGKVATAVVVEAGRAVSRGLEDITENISDAMDTSLEFTPSSTFDTTSLSFEDAYHVHIPTITTTSSSSTSLVPDLINLATPPSSFTSPKLATKDSSSSPNVLHLNTSAISSPLQRPQTISRSTSSSSICITTFGDDVEYVKSMNEESVDKEGNLGFFAAGLDNESEFQSDGENEADTYNDKEGETW